MSERKRVGTPFISIPASLLNTLSFGKLWILINSLNTWYLISTTEPKGSYKSLAVQTSFLPDSAF